VISPPGIGEDLEYWGYRLDNIFEMDWNEEQNIYCLILKKNHLFQYKTFKKNSID